MKRFNLKRAAILVLALAMLIISALALQACNNDPPVDPPPEPPAPTTYTITVEGYDNVVTGEDGSYTLIQPEKLGYGFVKWVTASGADFAASGTITEDVSIKPVFNILKTTTVGELAERAAGGVDKILLDADIVIDRPIYVVDTTTIYAEKDVTITRHPGYVGDIFVVGIDANKEPSVLKGKDAILTFDTEDGSITVDGNRDNTTVTVVGSAIFVTDSGVVNFSDGFTVKNCFKDGNDLAYICTRWVGDWMASRAGGAAILILNGSVNMYGGVIENNKARCERTIFTTSGGSESWSEDAGCGGAIYNCGNFNMYGGIIRNNEALYGGGIYNDEIVRLVSGEISSNKSYSKGGGVASSTSEEAEMYIGTDKTGVDKIVFKNNEAQSGGALYSNTDSPIVVLGNARFESNVSELGGGAIYTAGALTVRGSEFVNNSTPNSGGAIYFYYNYKSSTDKLTRRLELTNCTFSDNESTLGGAVAISASNEAKNKEEGAYAKITGCIFEANTANNCGALYVTRFGEATVLDSVFKNNTTPGMAGAITIQENCTLTCKNVTFEGNTAAAAGALYVYNANLVTLEAVTFKANSATNGNGGAIYFNATEITFDEHSSFINNTATNQGGAIYASYKTNSDSTLKPAILTVNGSSFEGNSALYGGAISARTSSTVVISGASFKNNATPNAQTGTDAGGGVLYSDFSDITITDTVFDGSASGYYGGALKLHSCDTEINDSTFKNGEGGTGASIYAYKGTLSADGLILTSNVSEMNGIIYLANIDAVIDNLTATGNSAIYGGVIYASGNDWTLLLKNSEFTENTATYGGAVYATGTLTLNIESSEFDGNEATADGGAVYSTVATVTARSTTFTENSAVRGGAIYLVDAATLTMTGGAFTSNCATADGGAISIRSGCTATLTSVTATGNTAGGTADNQGGGAVYVGWGTLNLDSVTMTGNTAGGYGGAVNANNATLNVKGLMTVKNNKVGNNASNIYLTPTKNITINGALTEGSSIGVTASERVFAEGDGTVVTDLTGYGEYFVSDAGYITTAGSGVIYFGGQTHPACGAECEHTESHASLSFMPVSSAAELIAAVNAGGNYYLTCDIEISARLNVSKNFTLCLNGKMLSASTSVGDFTMIKVSGATLTITDCQTTERVGYIDPATGKWCAGTSATAPQVTLKGGIISGAHGTWGGAINATSSATLNLYGINIINSTAANEGGAIYAEITSSINVYNTAFVANKATSHAGAVYLLSGSTLNMTGGSFIANSALDGGAISVRSTCAATLTSVTLTGNTASGTAATQGGGAIYVGWATLTLNGVTMTENSVSGGYGGAVNADNATVTVTDSTFTSSSASYGGAIYAGTSTLTVDGCTFTSNSATNGGAINTNKGVTVINSDFTENSASYGGAIYAAGNYSITVQASSFAENVATADGGAIYSTVSKITSTDSSFTENGAGRGGAIYLVDAATLTMTGGAFTSNCATTDGGAISIRSGCAATLTSVTATGNTAGGTADNQGGGVVYVGWGTLNLDSVTMTGNTAGGYGGAVNANNATLNVKGLMTVKNNKVGNNASNIYLTASKKITINGALTEGSYIGVTAGERAFASGDGTTVTDVSAYAPYFKDDGGKPSVANAGAVYFGKSHAICGASCTHQGAHAEVVYIPVSTEAELSAGLIAGGNYYLLNDVTISARIFTYANATLCLNGKILSASTSVGDFTMIKVSGATLTITDCSDIERAGYVDPDTGKWTAGTSATAPAVTLKGGIISGAHGTWGGAINVTGSATLNLYAINIINSTSTNEGGAIYSDGAGKINTYGTSFIANSATKHAGAIYGSASSVIALNGGRFEYNVAAATDGGAIKAYNSTLTVSGTLFNKNSSSTYGGAVYANKGASVSGATFTDNTSAYGGAIFTAGDFALAIDTSTFTGNSATADGGAVYSTVSKITATDSSFAENGAGRGGAIYLVDAATLTMTGGSFTGNTATTDGGAISIRSNCAATLTSVTATGNTAGGTADNQGGGVVYVGWGTLNLDSVTMRGNTAGGYGGAVNANNATLNVKGLMTVKNNKVGNDTSNIYLTPTKNITINGALTEGSSIGVTTSERVFAISDGVAVTDLTGYDVFFTNDNGHGIASDTTSVSAVHMHAVCAKSCAHTDAHGSVQFMPVSSASELIAAVEAGGYYYLTSDVEVSARLNASKDFTLCLNGKTLSASTSVGDFTIIKISGAILTITDCQTTERVGYIDPATGKWCEGTYIGEGNAPVVTLRGGIISGAHGTWGGAINVTSSATLNLYGINIINSTSTNEGGAIYSDGAGKINTYGTSFIANSATKHAGAIYGSASSTVTVTGGRFEYNSAAATDGGAIKSYNSTLTVNGALFNANSASTYGGAIHTNKGGSISNSTFTNNKTSSGGAVFSTGDFALTVNNSTFTGNVATADGGALYASASKVTVTGNTAFSRNSAARGGAIYLVTSGGTLTMTGGSFTDNSATTDGGAISIRSNCTATLSSTVFSKNTAAGTSETQGGGAIYVGWGTLTLNGVTMTGNSAENGYGGAVNANNASFSVEGGSFTQNSAISGGAIYLASNSASVANVKNASFSDNTATNGTNIKCGGQQTVATENGTFTEV